jgi:hypothetical protein
LLITLKDLAMVCTENASLAVLGHDYDLPTLRALGISYSCLSSLSISHCLLIHVGSIVLFNFQGLFCWKL